MKIMFIGDIVGNSGKEAILKYLPSLKRQYRPQLTIANGENISDGRGISEKDYKFLMSNGIDVITLGNHAFDHSSIFNYINDAKCLLRPYNTRKSLLGKGLHYIKINDTEIAIVNLLGSVFMDTDIVNPFEIIDELIGEVSKRVKHIFIDFHAETTSEKLAFANYLDGKVSAIVGTHTHVQTNDARVLPSGTAYITDVGMTGVEDSVIGFNKFDSIHRFRTQEPVKLRQASGNKLVMGAVLIELDEQTGLSRRIQIIEQMNS